MANLDRLRLAPEVGEFVRDLLEPADLPVFLESFAESATAAG
ncbi:hypothetical protein OG871_02015 [Kitasatospora sp. NBC_00374]